MRGGGLVAGIKVDVNVKVILRKFKRKKRKKLGNDVGYRGCERRLFFFFIQFNVPFMIISLIETSKSIGGAKREYPGKTT